MQQFPQQATQTVSFDLDGVLTDYQEVYLDIVFEITNIKFDRKSLTHFDTTLCENTLGQKITGKQYDQIRDRLVTARCYELFPEKEGVMNVCRFLDEEKYIMIINTSRDSADKSLKQAIKEQTQRWVNAHVAQHLEKRRCKIEYAIDGTTKKDICLQNNSIAHVDDNIENIINVGEIPDLLPILFDASYNERYSAVSQREIIDLEKWLKTEKIDIKIFEYAKNNRSYPIIRIHKLSEITGVLRGLKEAKKYLADYDRLGFKGFK